MYPVPINIVVVIIAAIATQLIGMLWYSRFVFGKQWARLSGAGELDAHKGESGRWKIYLINFVASIVMTYVLALLMSNLVIINLAQGIMVGVWVWLGFVATTSLPDYLFSVKPKPKMLYILNNGYHLVSFIIASLIFTTFL